MKRTTMMGWALGITMALSGSAQASTWTRVSGTGDVPSGRTTPAVAALDGRIYLFGGVRDDFATFTNDFFDDLFRFDPDTGSWVELDPPGAVPPARTFAAATAHDDRGLMLVFGGSVYDPTFSVFQVFDDLWAYSPDQDVWAPIVANNPGPSARSGPTMWVHDDRLFVFGGITQFFELRNDLWAYDFTTNTWTELIEQGAAGSPPGRHVIATGREPVQGSVTIYGGEAIDYSTFGFVILEDVWSLDLDTLQWTDVTPAPSDDLPLHRNYGAAETVGQRLYFHGGDIPGGTSGCGAPFPQNVTDEIWSFHLVQHRWRQEQPGGEPTPRLKRTASAVVDENLYVLSGWDFQCTGGTGPGQVFNTDVWIFDHDG